MQILLYILLVFSPSLVRTDASSLDISSVQLSLNHEAERVQALFRKIKVSGTDGDYVITGDAKTTTGLFYYTVEDGHHEYLRKKLVSAPDKWNSFRIHVQISKVKLPKNGTLLIYLSEKDKDGHITYSIPVVLERFNRN